MLPRFTSSGSTSTVTITYPSGSSTDVSLVKFGNMLRNSSATPWIDTKLFPILRISSDASAKVYWGIGEADEQPNSYAIAVDTVVPGPGKNMEFDARTRWVRIVLEGTGTLSYTLKERPTGIKLVDDAGSIVSIDNSSLRIVYRDMSLGSIGYTGMTASGNAMWTILGDVNGAVVSVTDSALGVALRDGSGVNLTSVRGNGDTALAIAPTDISSNVQAATDEAPEARTGRVSLVYALADISGVQLQTTKNAYITNNALYVHCVDELGNSVSTENPMYIALGGDSIPGYVVDSSLGNTLTDLVNINSSHIGGSSFNIDSLNLCNTAPTTVWFKIYDTHPGLITYTEQTSNFAAINGTLKLNIPVPANSSRDIRFEKGLTFSHGMCARASTEHSYDVSTTGHLGATQAYISATHSKVSLSTAQLAENSARRPGPVPNRSFDTTLGGQGVRGYINTLSTSKIMFTPTMATTIEGAITLSLNDMSGDPIPLANRSEYTTLNNFPLIAGNPAVMELATPTDMSGYTVVVHRESDISYAHIDVINYSDVTSTITDPNSADYNSHTTFTRYGERGVFVAHSGDDVLKLDALRTTGARDTDISLIAFYRPGNFGSNDGSTDISAIIVQPNARYTTSRTDMSAYLITQDASVYAINVDTNNDNQYVYRREVGDASSNRWSYFGISAEHTGFDNWCFSTPYVIGHVTDIGPIYRTTLVRKQLPAMTVNVFYNDGTNSDVASLTPVNVTHQNGYVVAYYDSNATVYSWVRILIGSNIYLVYLDDPGTGRTRLARVSTVTA